VALADSILPAPLPITFNVQVNAANLLPEVQGIKVMCTVLRANTPIARGYGSVAASGSFNGVVPVGINQLVEDFTIADLGQVNSYTCALMLEGPEGRILSPEASGPLWVQPKPEANFVNSLLGPYPPPAPGNQ
jgi:hypothetical protein